MNPPPPIKRLQAIERHLFNTFSIDWECMAYNHTTDITIKELKFTGTIIVVDFVYQHEPDYRMVGLGVTQKSFFENTLKMWLKNKMKYVNMDHFFIHLVDVSWNEEYAPSVQSI